MRYASIRDGWRRASNLERYPIKLEKIKLKNVVGFDDSFSLDFESGMTAICGKNGVGKSTLLKKIADVLSSNSYFGLLEEESIVNVFPDTLLVNRNETPPVFYIDPSYECSQIIDFLTNTQNVNELYEGVEPNQRLGSLKFTREISRIVGKPYKKIEAFELENVMNEEHTFPYFRVVLADETEYDSLNMGMGEHLCMYLCWLIHWLDSNIILLIEEIENYLSAHSQTNLLDYLVYVLSDKKVWTILTTHSEHILNKVGINNTRIIYRKGAHSLSVKPTNALKYLNALGLSSNKKGLYLLEDFFASENAKLIINAFDPILLDERNAIQLRCDSNLEKLIKHWQPTPTPYFDLMCIFDADQKEKIEKLFSQSENVNVIALPSANAKNPEEEIWSALKSNISEVANLLNICDTRLSDAVERYEFDDHHERYNFISETIGILLETLISSIFNVWLKNDDNYQLCVEFILALNFRNNSITKQDVIEYLTSLEINAASISVITDRLDQKRSDKFRFVFIGDQLQILEQEK